MSGKRCTAEFKAEAVRQVTERGYSVGEVAERLGLSAHSLYKRVDGVRQHRARQRRLEHPQLSGA